MNNYRDKIIAAISKTITETHLDGEKRSGKVRDIYDQGDHLTIVTTDRLSAFDRVLAAIPFKGQVLNQISAWWFEQTKQIVPNHFLSLPQPNTMVVKKCEVFPVEFVVRGYATGTTATSLWTHYAKGEREYCGHTLPDGLKKNQRLPKVLLTPTTKSDVHDELLSATDVVSKGLMSEEDWRAVSEIALRLFTFASQIVAERGLILVDTKYEFGRDEAGNITIIDELHTPDSSRYWSKETYANRFAAGQPPDNFDKDIIRVWYKEHSDPYHDEVLPEAPEDLIVKVASCYIELYERITGRTFSF